jgi:AcrR family transcriptional regulator
VEPMQKDLSTEKIDRIPPRERILAGACELFYRHGIRAVGVEAVAEAAGTNKMTLYRHFASKDQLVAEYLRCLAVEADGLWARLETQYPFDARAQLGAWVKTMAAHLANPEERGCALANAAVELPERQHPARQVIEEFKCAQRQRLVRLCQAAQLSDPELLADELFLLLEGARVTAQSMGAESPGAHLLRMADIMIAAHAAQAASALCIKSEAGVALSESARRHTVKTRVHSEPVKA